MCIHKGGRLHEERKEALADRGGNYPVPADAGAVGYAAGGGISHLSQQRYGLGDDPRQAAGGYRQPRADGLAVFHGDPHDPHEPALCAGVCLHGQLYVGAHHRQYDRLCHRYALVHISVKEARSLHGEGTMDGGPAALCCECAVCVQYDHRRILYHPSAVCVSGRGAVAGSRKRRHRQAARVGEHGAFHAAVRA